ncbi:plasmid mobilization relaxosome protein MobC [Allopusillimonas ginsengisoli]|uniref:plasmid mobilization relaxosome protein MobC n=1 Tax=Allopusillimonas ginsengisoli TaxID=453575 RepID=UPI0010200ACA|nr:plasmid mobilization relaxosome protein MobC [Allopusillimonas ginsengisoli]TEA79179.1 plasmid mobilization relaxosome protein MobC [Allopusillimonas ginsengisoli]
MSFNRPPITEEFRDAVEHNTSRSRHAKTPTPFSLRLTAEEKAELLRRAGNIPLGAYIRSQLLTKDEQSPRRSSRRPARDEQALARLLGELGKAKLSNNLNQLAKAVHTGSLPVTQETGQALEEACRDVRWMRDTLILALGLRSQP